MESLVPIALFGWVGLSFLAFIVLDLRWAILATYVLGWLLLPVARIEFRGGLPDYTKVTATAISCALGIGVFGIKELISLRPGFRDLPILVLWLSSGVSSLANGHDLYDAASQWIELFLMWVVPYVAGRAFFRRAQDLRQLCWAIVLGGLIYLPLCAYEIRMSPQLHRIVYGFFHHQFFQTMRSDGSFRPTVFMEHGLMVGLWMCMAALIALVFWRSRASTGIFGVPMWLLSLMLAAVAVLCRSTGATVLLLLGLLAYGESRLLGTRCLLIVLALVPLSWVLLRVCGGVSGEAVIRFVTQLDSARAESLEFRFHMENLILDACREKPWLGWSSWGITLPDTPDGEPTKLVVDSFWMFLFMRYGAIGLGGFLVAGMVPVVLLLMNRPKVLLHDPAAVSHALLVLVFVLWMVDSMANAMFNPVYVVVAGAATGITVERPEPVVRPAVAVVPADARI